jgi:hypothetical protein
MICPTYRAHLASAVEPVEEQLEVDRVTMETRALAHCDGVQVWKQNRI